MEEELKKAENLEAKVEKSEEEKLKEKIDIQNKELEEKEDRIKRTYGRI